ncbi:hypothetical protein [Candidatus Xenohaliotis californiensis]
MQYISNAKKVVSTVKIVKTLDIFVFLNIEPNTKLIKVVVYKMNIVNKIAAILNLLKIIEYKIIGDIIVAKFTMKLANMSHTTTLDKPQG